MKTFNDFKPTNYKSESLGSLRNFDTHFSSDKFFFKGTYRDNIFTDKEKAKSQSILLKKQLTESINSLNNQSNSSIRAKIAYKTLDFFINSSKFYHKELKTCLEALFPIIFCDKKQIKPEIISWIYDKYDILAAETDNSLPYLYICEYLYHALTQSDAQINLSQVKIKELKLNIQEKSYEIDELRRDYIKVLQRTDGSEAKNQLKVAMAKIISTRENFEKKIKDLTESLNDVNNQLQAKEEEIKNKNVAILRKTQEFKDLTEDYQELRDKLEEVVNENKKLSTYVKALIAKVKSINKENLRIQENLREAEAEISKLFVRAAGGYTSLTPRPDFDKVMDLLQSNIVENSTRARVDFLINYFLTNRSRRKLTSKHNTKPQSPR